ncbi:DVU_1555 family C-GCAxxG-C-C protein [Desulfococcus sp.]|uniref:DVU_1555 family C-GCAxxG-C-C protein n=1 Tax=Desulfococcus sp. TaxID=2025834 RepID=UPI0035936F9E
MDDLMFEMVTLGSRGYCCSQILMILALKERSAENPDLVRAMAGLCRGGGTCRGPCGVLTGAACVIALYAAKGAVDETESERLPLMIDTLNEWFAETAGSAFGGTACGDILGEVDCRAADPSRCGQVLVDTCQKVWEILEENGFDLSGSDD